MFRCKCYFNCSYFLCKINSYSVHNLSDNIYTVNTVHPVCCRYGCIGHCRHKAVKNCFCIGLITCVIVLFLMVIFRCYIVFDKITGILRSFIIDNNIYDFTAFVCLILSVYIRYILSRAL